MFLSLTDHFLIRASAALEKLKLLCEEEEKKNVQIHQIY